MDFGKIFADLFNRPQPLGGNEATFGTRPAPAGGILNGPITEGFNRVFNDPFANQAMLNDIKARQAATPTPGTLANPGAAGAGWISRIGNGLGIAQG